MAAGSAAELMELWDALAPLTDAGREAVLATRWLGRNDGDPAAASLGARQAAILRGFAEAFGRRLCCLDDCPACSARVAAEIPLDDLLTAQAAAGDCGGRLTVGDWQVDYRLPTATDLAAAAEAPDEDDAAARLKAATIRALRHSGSPAAPEGLPAEVEAELARRIEAEDPLAAAEIAVDCPDCGHRWVSGLDAAALFQARLEAWARRTLWEVHHLAMRYGWAERDILAMAPHRREAYLLMDAP